ncbi:unnamed protein product, partial [Pleuronectes platessa]
SSPSLHSSDENGRRGCRYYDVTTMSQYEGASVHPTGPCISIEEFRRRRLIEAGQSVGKQGMAARRQAQPKLTVHSYDSVRQLSSTPEGADPLDRAIRLLSDPHPAVRLLRSPAVNVAEEHGADVL